MEDLRQQIIDLLFENGFVNMKGNAYEQAEKIMGLMKKTEPVTEVPCSDRVMPARVEEEMTTYCIYIDEGIYVQRKDIERATDNPMSIHETLIIKLCETILGKQA